MRHRCKHHVMHQRACQVGAKIFLQHRMNRCAQARGTSVISSQKLKISSGPDEPVEHRCMGPVKPVTATSAVRRPTDSAEPRVGGCTGALPPVYPVPSQKSGQRLLTSLWTLWAIYMPSPGHFKAAGVTTSLKHTQEHLQAIQVLIDHIFSP